MKARVPQWGKANGYVAVDTEATRGAVVGVNLFWNDGTLVTEADFSPEPGGDPNDLSNTLWRLVLEIPPKVKALELATGTVGLFAVTGTATGALRSIAPVAGETTVTNGDGVAGNPAVGLADLANSGGGTLQKTARDTKGRLAGTSAATTDDLAEGAINKYFPTVARQLVDMLALQAEDGSYLQAEDNRYLFTETY